MIYHAFLSGGCYGLLFLYTMRWCIYIVEVNDSVGVTILEFTNSIGNFEKTKLSGILYR